MLGFIADNNATASARDATALWLPPVATTAASPAATLIMRLRGMQCTDVSLDSGSSSFGYSGAPASRNITTPAAVEYVPTATSSTDDADSGRSVAAMVTTPSASGTRLKDCIGGALANARFGSDVMVGAAARMPVKAARSL